VQPKPYFVVGVGGATKSGSSTEQALTQALSAAARLGAETRLFDGAFLASLPHYDPDAAGASAAAQDFIAAVRRADGIIIASPGYHGTVSGLVKNAIDYLEETARDARVYLDGVPVGLIVTAYGWQATGSTLAALRAIVHSLRGWPTPLGATVNSLATPFKDGVCTDPAASQQLEMVGRQVVEFAGLRQTAQAAPSND
jgi:FMN reductase